VATACIQISYSNTYLSIVKIAFPGLTHTELFGAKDMLNAVLPVLIFLDINTPMDVGFASLKIGNKVLPHSGNHLQHYPLPEKVIESLPERCQSVGDKARCLRCTFPDPAARVSMGLAPSRKVSGSKRCQPLFPPRILKPSIGLTFYSGFIYITLLGFMYCPRTKCPTYSGLPFLL
jgi:hypothetical protein